VSNRLVNSDSGHTFEIGVSSAIAALAAYDF